MVMILRLREVTSWVDDASTGAGAVEESVASTSAAASGSDTGPVETGTVDDGAGAHDDFFNASMASLI